MTWVFQYCFNNREGFHTERYSLPGYETALDAYEAMLRTHYAEPHREYAIRVWNSLTQEIAYQSSGRVCQVSEVEFTSKSPDSLLEDSKGDIMIDVGIKREKGKLYLVINAKDFHDTLDSIGCTHTNGVYDNPPNADATVMNARFEMSTKCLLVKQYPAKFDLTGLTNTPPRNEQLKGLCESAYAAGRRILDHYQPIDISIQIQKKLIR
jgi:hypothetical protein